MSSVSGAHRDSRIEGLDGGGRPERVMVLGVDSVTDDSNDVDGSVSGRPIGEGPGRYGGTGLMGLVAETGGSGTSADRSDSGTSTDRSDSGASTDRSDSGTPVDRSDSGTPADGSDSGTSADHSDSGTSADPSDTETSADLSDGDDSLDKRLGLNTDSGSGTSLAEMADILVETGKLLPMSEGELIVERSSDGKGGNSGSMKITGGSGIGSGEVSRTASAAAPGRRGGMAT